MDQRRRARGIARSNERFYWYLVLPALTIFAAFGLYPFVRTLFLSVTTDSAFVGFTNYKRLFHDPVVLTAIKNTCVFVVGSVSIELILGFLAAFIMNRRSRSRPVLRVLSFLPWTLPVVVAGIMFKFMLNDVGGVVNTALVKVGLLQAPLAWTADKRYAMGALVAADSWKSFPILAFLILAGLQQLPEELFEAARIDGAGRIRIFLRISLPLLKRVLFVALMIRCMQGVAYAYDMVYSLTRGGPGDSTQVLVSLAQKYSFRFMEFHAGAAVAVLALLVGIAFGASFLTLIIRGRQE